jgi:hypothetical protein
MAKQLQHTDFNLFPGGYAYQQQKHNAQGSISSFFIT